MVRMLRSPIQPDATSVFHSRATRLWPADWSKDSGRTEGTELEEPFNLRSYLRNYLPWDASSSHVTTKRDVSRSRTASTGSLMIPWIRVRLLLARERERTHDQFGCRVPDCSDRNVISSSTGKYLLPTAACHMYDKANKIIYLRK